MINEEEKKKQSQGNTVERLARNQIRTMFNHSNMTPFICFGWGYKLDSLILACVSIIIS